MKDDQDQTATKNKLLCLEVLKRLFDAESASKVGDKEELHIDIFRRLGGEETLEDLCGHFNSVVSIKANELHKMVSNSEVSEHNRNPFIRK